MRFAEPIPIIIVSVSAFLLSVISATSDLAESSATAEQITSTDNNITTTTPIKPLVVIYQENIAFDTYFATYPNAENPPGEPQFTASPDTPSINGLTDGLLYNNTNLVNPFRFDREYSKIVAVCGNAHDYSDIQKTYNGGLLDKFVFEGNVYNTTSKSCDPSQPMGFFDGNALWNYAQHFAMSDNFYSTVFGSSLPGHINLISGQTHGVIPEHVKGSRGTVVSNGTLIGNLDATFDDCSEGQTASFTGINVGDLLNKKEVTWGWFQGGFKPTSRIATQDDDNSTAVTDSAAAGKAVCDSAHLNIAGQNITDYVVHHEPFQYYDSTSNPHHLPPTSVEMIGRTDQANHQYDLADFWNVAKNGSLPAVSFLKASQYQTGHPGGSDPLDEQEFIVNTINRVQQLPEWNHTAIIIAYDDSGGWYDHVMPPIISQSNDPNDTLLGPDLCGKAPPDAYQGRCGYGGRLPMLVVSPWAKVNYVDHMITDQTSILRFIEDNWELGRIGDQSFDEKAGSILGMFNFTDGHYARKLFLDPMNGTLLE